jgi:DNA-binding XRE family transcriptional regulator
MAHPMTVYRKRHGMTLAQLGALLGATKTAVYKWEHRAGPSPAMAIEIERLTNGALPKWDMRPDIWDQPTQDSAE